MIKKNFLDNKQSIHWLLKEKYFWPEGQIIDFLNNNNLSLLTPAIKKDVNKIVSGEPVNYVIGFVNFLNCHIDLSLKPLIPRPETEHWLKSVVDNLLPSRNFSILDLCCGSGCLGIACLKKIPLSQVDFVDISPQALRQTKINLRLNQISSDRFQVFQSDLFPSTPVKKYDLILTNPPYIDSAKPFKKELKFEPAVALFSSDHGLRHIKRIIQTFSQFIRPNGYLYLEFGQNQKELINKFCQTNNLNPHFYKDQFNRFRYLRLDTHLPRH